MTSIDVIPGRRGAAQERAARNDGRMEVARLKDIRLVPGMPAEVFIQTHERTPLGYLLKPLEEQIARTIGER